MKIVDIKAMRLTLPEDGIDRAAGDHPGGRRQRSPTPCRATRKSNDMRSLWLPKWDEVWCMVTAEDGTWGPGSTGYGRRWRRSSTTISRPNWSARSAWPPRSADMMFRLTKPYGTVGLASYAISAVDLALWDLKGKLLDQPVYVCSAARRATRCSAMPPATMWTGIRSLGFSAFKLACPYGPADGLDGLDATRRLSPASAI